MSELNWRDKEAVLNDMNENMNKNGSMVAKSIRQCWRLGFVGPVFPLRDDLWLVLFHLPNHHPFRAPGYLGQVYDTKTLKEHISWAKRMGAELRPDWSRPPSNNLPPWQEVDGE